MIVTTRRYHGEFAESSAEPRRKFRGEFAERPVCDFGVRTTLAIRRISLVVRMSVPELLANVQCPPRSTIVARLISLVFRLLLSLPHLRPTTLAAEFRPLIHDFRPLTTDY